MQHMWLMRLKCVQLSALWTLWRIGQIQEELIGSWHLKHRRFKTIRQQVTEVISQSWEKNWRNGVKRNWTKVGLLTVFRSNQRMNIKGKVLEFTKQGNLIRSQWLQCCTVRFILINSLGGRTLAGFRWNLSKKWRKGLLCVFRRLQSCCCRTDRWARKIRCIRLEASRQQHQDYSRKKNFQKERWYREMCSFGRSIFRFVFLL